MDRNSDYLKMDRKPRFYNIEREKIEIKKPNNSLNIVHLITVADFLKYFQVLMR